MNLPSSNRFRRYAATALLSLSMVSACATAPTAERPTIRRAGPSSASPEAVAAGAMAAGPAAGQFIGRPAAFLDQALGAPDLVRREGTTEFRRYDIADCRTYAIVGEDGAVSAISTGPAVVGAPAPDFSSCAAQARR